MPVLNQRPADGSRNPRVARSTLAQVAREPFEVLATGCVESRVAGTSYERRSVATIARQHVGRGAEDFKVVQQKIAEVGGVQGLESLLVIAVEIERPAVGTRRVPYPRSA